MIQMYKNTPLFYSSVGTGNPLVLLHGFLESSSIWEPFVGELSLKRQIITIDLPGHGRSGNIADCHSMELMADAVHEILTHLQIKNATIMGHSMGGYVSLEFCKKFPIMTQGLVLLNSTPEADSEERKKNRSRSIKIIRRNKSSYISMAISNLLSEKNTKLYPEQVERLKNEAMSFSEEGIMAALEGMKIRTDNLSTLSGFMGPKYMINGTQDPILNFSAAERLAKTCNCKLFPLEGGHLSFIENEKELQSIMHFID